MIDFTSDATRTTPYVLLDSGSNIITFRGRSSPENAIKFYFPIIQKIRTLFASGDQPIVVEMAFMYFNTSSSKCLFDLFRALGDLQKGGRQIIVKWYYEEDDEDMFETGEDFAELLDLDFELIELYDINELAEVA